MDKNFREQLIETLKKLDDNVTILMPTASFFNEYVTEGVKSQFPNANIFFGVVRKITDEEVYDIIMDKSSYFRKAYKNNFKKAHNDLYDYLDLDTEKDDYMFSFDWIKDEKMKKVLIETLNTTDIVFANLSKHFNCRDVLIIDDRLNFLQKIERICYILKNSYAPKSITVLRIPKKES